MAQERVRTLAQRPRHTLSNAGRSKGAGEDCQGTLADEGGPAVSGVGSTAAAALP